MEDKTKRNIKTAMKVTGLALGATYFVMRHVAKKQYPKSVYADKPEEQNPMQGRKVIFKEDANDPVNADGKQGHLEAVANTTHIPTFYEKYVKRGFDVVLSFCGLVVLSPIYAVTALAIKVNDPGPVLFKQKRVGEDKSYFELLKFRSMSVNTPKDVPTHMLQNGGITKVGAFIRKTSIDELPQLWCIFKGNMSVIGPRPALWNQDYLTAERDKYGANDIKPGLTGLAQINGRDELEIPDKAKLDGVYAKALKTSSLSGFLMDVKMFFGSVFSVLKSDGVVEGGTGALEKKEAEAQQLRGYFNEEHEDLNKELTPLVSVIIATYHRKDSLENAIMSVINQTYSNIEIIVVDDNADKEFSNSAEEIIKKCRLKTKKNIVYVKNEHNLGSARTRNTGIDKASGDYISFLDDDDIYLPHKIERQLSDMLKENADYGITDLMLYNENDKLIDKRIRNYIESTNKNDLLRYHLLYHMTGTDTFMFKTEYLKRIGGFSLIDVGDEYYLMQKAISENGRICYSNHCYIKAYVHQGEVNGLSSGKGKIDGENALYREKKQYFQILSNKEVRYVNVRHFAVLAFTELRRKNYMTGVKYALQSFYFSPIQCVKLMVNR